MLISVIIVSYNVRYFIRQALDSLWKSAEKAQVDVEVYVVDNNSQDKSVEYLSTAFSDYLEGKKKGASLFFIANQHNVGFGRANNQALCQCKGDFVLFLNPDTILTEDTLKACIRHGMQYPKFGAIGVRMLNANGTFAPESRRGLPTPWATLCKLFSLNKLFPSHRLFTRYYLDYLPKSEPVSIEIVSGAFMFCNHDALKVTGGFDEDFFMYAEDTDLSYRFLKAGFLNYYVPTSIIHYKGESSKRGSFRSVFVFYEGVTIFFRKHYSHLFWGGRLLISIGLKFFLLLGLIRQIVYRLKNIGCSNKKKAVIHPSNRCKLELFSNSTLKRHFICPDDECNVANSEELLLFSPETQTYESIIHELESSDHKRSVATFFPSWEVMITGKEVFE